MARATALALRGWGRVAPNPLVGAVLLRDGTPVADGFHAEYGGPHAEAAALARCDDARGTTCVVTLEPCAHHGKTPPCADALIAAGVTRVVIAGRDPGAEARGGVERLRAAGVEVTIGAEAREAAAMNAAYLWGVARPERPFVALKLATSVDGFIADAAGGSKWISGEAAREFVHWLRAGFDAIGVGRRTVEVDDPALTVRGAVVPRNVPLRVVFARDGMVPSDGRLIATASETATLVIVGSGVAGRAAAQLGRFGVRVLGADGLGDALRVLRGEGVRSLLVEGGGQLAGALLDAGLVDRLYWIQSPIWLGGGVTAFGTRNAVPLGEALPWSVVERRALGPDTLLVVDRELCLPAS